MKLIKLFTALLIVAAMHAVVYVLIVTNILSYILAAGAVAFLLFLVYGLIGGFDDN